MIERFLLILCVAATVACKPSPTPPKTQKADSFECDGVVVTGEFNTKAKNITPPDAPTTYTTLQDDVVKALNDSKRELVCAVLARKGAKAPTTLSLGGEDDGLKLELVVNGKKIERRIPPASSLSELKTNVEHTLDSLVPDSP